MMGGASCWHAWATEGGHCLGLGWAGDGVKRPVGLGRTLRCSGFMLVFGQSSSIIAVLWRNRSLLSLFISLLAFSTRFTRPEVSNNSKE